MKNFENVKMNIILIIAIMLLLFTICLVLYSDLFFQKERMNIQTNYIFEGGKDNLSQTLENIIPYMDTTSPKYLTAYQDQNTSIINIHNDILLAKAIEELNYNDLTTLNIQNKIKDMYGDNYFITNKSLNVDGENICLYLNSYNNYSCSKQSIKQIKYKAKRKILDINISNLITLRENIL